MKVLIVFFLTSFMEKNLNFGNSYKNERFNPGKGSKRGGFSSGYLDYFPEIKQDKKDNDKNEKGIGKHSNTGKPMDGNNYGNILKGDV